VQARRQSVHHDVDRGIAEDGRKLGRHAAALGECGNLAGARGVELRGGRLSVVGVELDSEGSGKLAELVEGALYEWREKTASVRVPAEPEPRLAAVLALAEALREAARAPMLEKDMLPAS